MRDVHCNVALYLTAGCSIAVKSHIRPALIVCMCVCNSVEAEKTGSAGTRGVCLYDLEEEEVEGATGGEVGSGGVSLVGAAESSCTAGSAITCNSTPMVREKVSGKASSLL